MQADLFDAKQFTRKELREFGRSRRKVVNRSDLGRWQPPHDRPDPLTTLRAQDATRVQELVPIRYGRMFESPFTFYRGSAAVITVF